MPNFISDADMAKMDVASAAPQAGGKDFLSDDEMAAMEDGSFIPTLEEMHPDFTAADRLVVKNLGNDLDSSIAYLQKQHPGLEVGQDSGEIVARKPGEAAYRKLDPGGWAANLNPLELARDVGDLGYDVAAGVGSAAATVAGGLTGAAAGGVGAIPAAMAAGGASSAGLEALRQQLGKWAGVNQDISGRDVAYSGALGAASPLLLGSGASLAQAGKQALKEGGKRTAEEILAANRGYLSRAAPKVGEFVSGISEDVLKTAYNKMPEIDALDTTGIKNFASATRRKAADTVTGYTRSIGKQIGEEVKNLDGVVDIADARTPIMDLMGELSEEAAATGNEASQEAVDSLHSLLNKYFQKKEVVPAAEEVPHFMGLNMGTVADAAPKTVTVPINELEPKSAWELAKQLENFGQKYNYDGTGLTPLQGKAAPVADKRIGNAAIDAASRIRNQLDDVSGGRLAELNAKYSDALNLQKELRPMVKDARATYRNFSNVLSANNRVPYETLREVDGAFKTGLVDDAKLLAAYKNFSKAPWLAISSGGTTSTSRTVPISEALGDLGYWAGANSGMGQGMAKVGSTLGKISGATIGSPAMLRKYMAASRKTKFLEDQARKLSGGLPAARSGINSAWNAMLHGGE